MEALGLPKSDTKINNPSDLKQCVKEFVHCKNKCVLYTSGMFPVNSIGMPIYTLLFIESIP